MTHIKNKWTCIGIISEINKTIELHKNNLNECLPNIEHILSKFIESRTIQAQNFWPKSYGRYTRVELTSDSDSFQLILVFWPPGARSAIHSHDLTTGGVIPMYGRVKETKYKVVKQEKNKAILEASEETVMEEKVLSKILPSDGQEIHDMRNDSFEWAATLHVYLKKVVNFGLFTKNSQEQDLFQVKSIPFWVDYKGQASAWDQYGKPSNPDGIVMIKPQTGASYIKGECLCGETKFEATSESCLELTCNCSDCQRVTGSTTADLVFFNKDKVHFYSNKIQQYIYENSAGSKIIRSFCGGCGASLCQKTSSAPHLLAIHAGLIENCSEIFKPQTMLYLNNAPKWQTSMDDIHVGLNIDDLKLKEDDLDEIHQSLSQKLRLLLRKDTFNHLNSSRFKSALSEVRHLIIKDLKAILKSDPSHHFIASSYWKTSSPFLAVVA